MQVARAATDKVKAGAAKAGAVWTSIRRKVDAQMVTRSVCMLREPKRGRLEFPECVWTDAF